MAELLAEQWSVQSRDVSPGLSSPTAANAGAAAAAAGGGLPGVLTDEQAAEQDQEEVR